MRRGDRTLLAVRNAWASEELCCWDGWVADVAMYTGRGWRQSDRSFAGYLCMIAGLFRAAPLFFLKRNIGVSTKR